MVTVTALSGCPERGPEQPLLLTHNTKLPARVPVVKVKGLPKRRPGSCQW